MTSFDVVAILRSALKIKKIGHTGTLDPNATGVLPVCIGRATKLVDLLENTDKSYKARMLLGKRTDTLDTTGQVVEEISEHEVRQALANFASSDPFVPDAQFNEKLLEVFDQFTGTIEQIPPMYSALKVNGVKLVDAARKGKVIERKPRKVTIYGFKYVELCDDGLHISFEVNCSKGTYVRTLCEDIGKAMGLPACLEELERTSASGLNVSDSITVTQAKCLIAEGKIKNRILPVDSFLTAYPALTVNEQGLKKVLVGNFLYPDDYEMADGEGRDETRKAYRIYDENGTFYALYKYDDAKNCLRAEKMFLPDMNSK